MLGGKAGRIPRMKRVYLDHAATTPVDPQVVVAMLPYFQEEFGNPSSLHKFGRDAAEAISRARQEVADFLSATSEEIYFTASGTESNNLAILGTTRANKKRREVVTSPIEHPSVLNACAAAERNGNKIKFTKVEKSGLISLKEVVDLVSDETLLVSTHLANSEIGTVQNVSVISKAVKEKSPETLIHVDACQATSFLGLSVDELGVDLMSINGSKAYGPKGIGVLYVRKGTPIFPVIYGGGQEKSLRSGTENVPAIVGLAEALKVITVRRQRDADNIQLLRNDVQNRLSKMDGVSINVPESPRLPNHLSIQIESGQSDLVKAFDQEGIALSAGSACSSRSLSESNVLSAIGLDSSQINKTVRITLGRATTKEDVTTLLTCVKELVRR